jgi:sensor histidine kinase YesM
MAIKRSSPYTITAHIAGWVGFFFVPLLLSPGPDLIEYLSDAGSIASLIVRNLILMGLFYLNLFYLTPVLLQRKGLFTFIITITLLIVLISILNQFIHESLTSDGDFRMKPPRDFMEPGQPHRHRPLMIAGPFFSSLLITLMVAATSTLIVFWNNWNEARQQEQERALQKVAAELSVLKLQISPHFLFNTLNNIRWLIRSKSDQAEEAVVKLSQLLRYILYGTSQDLVPLEKEVENMEDFISLQQMRLSNIRSLQYTVEGNPKGQFIVPLLFIPLIENFFKYGAFEEDAENEIRFIIGENHVRFFARNKVSDEYQSNEPTSGGIGLPNVIKRLALHYPGRHSFKHTLMSGYFAVELDIILQ